MYTRFLKPTICIPAPSQSRAGDPAFQLGGWPVLWVTTGAAHGRKKVAQGGRTDYQRQGEK